MLKGCSHNDGTGTHSCCSTQCNITLNHLTLQRLTKLFYKLSAVLLCNTCKFHCIKKDLPCAVATVSLTPFVQAILNGFFFVTRIVLVARVNLRCGKTQILQDGSAFASTFSADMFSEKESVFLTICNRGGTTIIYCY